MAILANEVIPSNSLEEFRLEFNNLVTDVDGISGANAFGASIVFEGSTVDDFETTLAVVDPTADRTITLPNVTGTVSLIAATETLSNKTLVSPVITTSIHLADNVVQYFGTGSDLRIFHDSNNSYIDEQGTGALVIRSNLISFRNDNDDAYLGTFFEDGAIYLYYNGVQKFETTSSGVTVTGTITGTLAGNAATATALETAREINGVLFDGTEDITITASSSGAPAAGSLTGTTLASNVVASSLTSVGTLSQLTVNTSLFLNNSSGNAGLEVYGSTGAYIDLKNLSTDDYDFRIQTEGTTSRLINAVGTMEIKAAGNISLECTDSGGYVIFNDHTRIVDNKKFHFGSSNDLSIYHDGNNSYIMDQGTGILVIKSNYLSVRNAADTEYMATFIESGAVSLYYQASKRFDTTSAGVLVTGTLSVTSTIIATPTASLLIKNSSGTTVKTINGFTAS